MQWTCICTTMRQTCNIFIKKKLKMDQKLNIIVNKIDQNEILLKQITNSILNIHKELQNSMKCLQKSFQLICNAQYALREELSDYAGNVVDMNCDTNLF